MFSHGAVLIDTAAYQTYDGVLGVHLSKTIRAAADDPLMFALAIRDHERIAGDLNVLRIIDPSFALASGPVALPFQETVRSANGVQIVGMVGRGESGPASLMAFLIEQPVRSLVLHGPGIPVAVPAPERHVVYSMFARPENTQAVACSIAIVSPNSSKHCVWPFERCDLSEASRRPRAS